MGAPSVSEIARVVLPRSCLNGSLAMLSAYYDDSGTHDKLNVVVYGGLIGTEDQWTKFERAWKPKLVNLGPASRHSNAFICLIA